MQKNANICEMVRSFINITIEKAFSKIIYQLKFVFDSYKKDIACSYLFSVFQTIRAAEAICVWNSQEIWKKDEC